jgi:hypothetical protein
MLARRSAWVTACTRRCWASPTCRVGWGSGRRRVPLRSGRSSALVRSGALFPTPGAPGDRSGLAHGVHQPARGGDAPACSVRRVSRHRRAASRSRRSDRPRPGAAAVPAATGGASPGSGRRGEPGLRLSREPSSRRRLALTRGTPHSAALKMTNTGRNPLPATFTSPTCTPRRCSVTLTSPS